MFLRPNLKDRERCKLHWFYLIFLIWGTFKNSLFIPQTQKHNDYVFEMWNVFENVVQLYKT